MLVEDEEQTATLDDFLVNPKKVDTFADDNDEDRYDVKNGKFIYDNVYNLVLVGVLIKYKNKNIIVLNADTGKKSNFVVECQEYKFPTLSFACLSKFYNDKDHDSNKNIQQIAEMIARGRLKLVDFSEEEYKNIPAKEERLYKNWKDKGSQGKCPLKIPAGFSIVDLQFHKAGGCLIRDTNKNGKSMVFGVDENQYFGCELPTHPSSLKQAFIDLMPQKIRNIKGVERTGEWFLIPVERKDYPKENKFDVIFNNFDLPIDDRESNKHEVDASSGGIIDKVIYAENPTITHEQHEKLELEGYFYFVKNTALRSVSQEGVD